MNTVSRMEAASPRERPVILVTNETGSRLMIRNRFVRVTLAVFGFHYQFSGTLRTGINLTAGAGKAIAAVTVGEITLNRGATVMTENYFNQFVHTIDEELFILLLPNSQ